MLWSLLVLLFASSLPMMVGALIAPALPAINGAFEDQAHRDILLALVLTGPGLAVALTAHAGGVVADRIGRRRVLIAGLAIYGLAGIWPAGPRLCCRLRSAGFSSVLVRG